MARSIIDSVNQKNPVQVLLSGGIDSATLLFDFVASGRETSAVFFDYGQAAARKEEQAATTLAEITGVRLSVTRLPQLSPRKGGEFPGRNALFVILAASTHHGGGHHLALGIHAGTPYSDCSPPFVAAMQNILDLYYEGRTRLVAPFLHWTKNEVLQHAIEVRVPLEMTFSCERPDPDPCGTCLSCRDRLALRC